MQSYIFTFGLLSVFVYIVLAIFISITSEHNIPNGRDRLNALFFPAATRFHVDIFTVGLSGTGRVFALAVRACRVSLVVMLTLVILNAVVPVFVTLISALLN